MTSTILTPKYADETPTFEMRTKDAQRALLNQLIDKQRRAAMDEVANWAQREIKPSPRGVPT